MECDGDHSPLSPAKGFFDALARSARRPQLPLSERV